MLKRHVDVFFQYLRPFVAALAILPLGLGILGFAFDHAQVVEMQIWAVRPAFLVNPAANAASLDTSLSFGSAGVAGALVTELAGTDSFLDRVLAKTDAGFAGRSASSRSAERSQARRSLNVRVEGPQLFAISYRSDRPERGIAFLTNLMAGVNETVATLELQQASATGGATADQLSAAQLAMNRALAQLQKYQGQDPTALQEDPTYLTLSAQANAATGRYLTLVAQLQQADLAKSAVGPLEQAAFQVVDPPALQPRVLDLKSLAVRGFLGGLAAIIGLEAMMIYVIGRRDPRLRSGEEVRLDTGLPFLGSTPVVSSAA